MKKIIENKKILITGGAGFIGSNLIEKFILQNNKIVCIDNLSTGKIKNIEPFQKNDNFKFVNGDISDFKTCDNVMKDIEIVFHQAALGSVPRSIADPINTNNSNITGFLNVLQAATKNKVKRFVYAASSSTYGDSKSLPKIEDKIGKPLSPYAITKLVNELYAEIFSNLYGIETIGLRYFNVFGRRQDPDGAYAAVIPKFVHLLINKKAPTINGDGLQTRDFTYIDNVVQANELSATTTNKKALNQVYNVAFGDNINLNELYDTLKSLLSKKDAEINKIKVIHGKNRLGDIQNSLASINKAKKLLGYNPQFSVKHGLEKAVQWYWENL